MFLRWLKWVIFSKSAVICNCFVFYLSKRGISLTQVEPVKRQWLHLSVKANWWLIKIKAWMRVVFAPRITLNCGWTQCSHQRVHWNCPCAWNHLTRPQIKQGSAVFHNCPFSRGDEEMIAWVIVKPALMVPWLTALSERQLTWESNKNTALILWTYNGVSKNVFIHKCKQTQLVMIANISATPLVWVSFIKGSVFYTIFVKMPLRYIHICLPSPATV